MSAVAQLLVCGYIFTQVYPILYDNLKRWAFFFGFVPKVGELESENEMAVVNTLGPDELLSYFAVKKIVAEGSTADAEARKADAKAREFDAEAKKIDAETKKIDAQNRTKELEIKLVGANANLEEKKKGER